MIQNLTGTEFLISQLLHIMPMWTILVINLILQTVIFNQ